MSRGPGKTQRLILDILEARDNPILPRDLARLLDRDERPIRRALKSLRERGLVEVTTGPVDWSEKETKDGTWQRYPINGHLVWHPVAFQKRAEEIANDRTDAALKASISGSAEDREEVMSLVGAETRHEWYEADQSIKESQILIRQMLPPLN